MSELGKWTLGLGLVMLFLHGYAAGFPAKARVIAERFPRNVWAGRMLATVAFLWAGWLVYEMPLGGFEHLKKWLFIVTPVVIGMSFFYMRELLAPRAAGALMLLYPAPVLALARFHDSPLSLVMTVVCYLIIVKGMILVMSPWFFRKSTERFVTSDARCRMLGFFGVCFDVMLIVLAVVVY